MVVFGIGTGRCGTQSLAKLLNTCRNTRVTHEGVKALAWERNDKDKMRARAFIDGMVSTSGGDVVGDVSFVWGGYLDVIHSALPNARILLMVREPEDVVDSFRAKWGGINLFLPDAQHTYAGSFPTFEGGGLTYNLLDYYDLYHGRVMALCAKHGIGVYIIPMRYLNSKEGQEKILRAAGIPRADWPRIRDSVHVGHR